MPPSASSTALIFSFESFGLSPTEKNTRSPRMPAKAECVAAFKFPPFLESKLYIGIPSVSLNHNTNFTESWGVGGCKSQGNSMSFSGAAQTTRAGTGNIKRRKMLKFFDGKVSCTAKLNWKKVILRSKVHLVYVSRWRLKKKMNWSSWTIERNIYHYFFWRDRHLMDWFQVKKSNLMKNSNRIFVMETNKHRINEIFSSTCYNGTKTNLT